MRALPSIRSPQKEHLGYRMIALEVDDMQQTADYLKEKGVDIVWGPVVRPTYARAEICRPHGSTSNCGNGSSEAGCGGPARRAILRPFNASREETMAKYMLVSFRPARGAALGDHPARGHPSSSTSESDNRPPGSSRSRAQEGAGADDR